MKSESPVSESRWQPIAPMRSSPPARVPAAGKAVSSMNAVKTGLTGRTVLLPSDDAEAYRQHLAAYENEFKPVGLRECELVQSLADIQWRLQRIPGLEMAIYARGRDEFFEQFEDFDPAARSARIDLETFIHYQKPLRNLQLQEGRLRRQREKDMAELRELQQERRTTRGSQSRTRQDHHSRRQARHGIPRRTARKSHRSQTRSLRHRCPPKVWLRFFKLSRRVGFSPRVASPRNAAFSRCPRLPFRSLRAGNAVTGVLTAPSEPPPQGDCEKIRWLYSTCLATL